MKTMQWVLVLTLAGTLTAWSDDLLIQSFDTSGKVTFNTVTNAVGYRVEWASTAGGAWTNFGLPSLDQIPATGSGIVTASVPMLYRVVATVNTASPPPGMVLILAGSFVMGNATNVFPASEGNPNELPQHTVYVSSFYMERYKVTKALWDEVKTWAATNGYAFNNPGEGKATNHPVHTVDWYDCVKWCNARSQRDGLTPAFYTDSGLSVVYKSNSVSPYVNWSANGYRLATEAEWEKAARGGVANTRFPWTDYTNRISHVKANYYGQKSSHSYDLSSGWHPAYYVGDAPYTSPVGSFAPNGYGLYDMVGNIQEWVWDWYDGNYYLSSPGTDPKGATSSVWRVRRGAGWSADDMRCSYRYGDYGPDDQSFVVGFRCARGL